MRSGAGSGAGWGWGEAKCGTVAGGWWTSGTSGAGPCGAAAGQAAGGGGAEQRLGNQPLFLAPPPAAALTKGVGAEAPDRLGHLLVPAKLLRQDLGADLGVVAGAHLAVVNRLGQALLQGARLRAGWAGAGAGRVGVGTGVVGIVGAAVDGRGLCVEAGEPIGGRQGRRPCGCGVCRAQAFPGRLERGAAAGQVDASGCSRCAKSTAGGGAAAGVWRGGVCSAALSVCQWRQEKGGRKAPKRAAGHQRTRAKEI